MKITKTILVAVVAVLVLSFTSGCNTNGARVRVLPIGDQFSLLEAELQPTGININKESTSELLYNGREKHLQDMAIELSEGKNPVITKPEDVKTVIDGARKMNF